MRRVTRFLFFLVPLCNCCMASKLTDRASYIANKEFELRLITCIIWWHADSEHVDVFLEKFKGIVTTLNMQKIKATDLDNFHKFVRYKQTVFFATHSEEFKMFLKLIKNRLVATIKVVLIVTKPVNNIKVLSKYTKVAWENDVGYIIILHNKNIDDKISLTSYVPFSQGKCNNYNPMEVADNTSNYFERNFANFQRCPVRFTALQFPPFFIFDDDNGTVTRIGGIDGEVLKLLLENLNATMDIVSSTDHGGIGKVVNGTATGCFGDLVSGIADTMALAIILNYDRHLLAQLTYVYATLDVMWCAPNRREISSWAKVLLPFFTTITPFLVLSFALFIGLVMLVQRFAVTKGTRKSSYMTVVYQTLGLFLGQTIEFMSNYWLHNSVFALWIWFCLIVRVVYQSNLVEGFQRTILEPHLTTVQEALNYVDGYGGVPGFLEFYHNTSIEKNYQTLTLSDMPVYIRQIAQGRRFLLTVDALLVKYLNQTVQFLDERVTRIPVCFFTRPRWPAAEEFNKVIVQITEAGFVAKILRDHTAQWLLHSNVTHVESVKPIDFLTLSACFYGLIVMCCICTIILGCEVFYNKYKKHNQLNCLVSAYHK